MREDKNRRRIRFGRRLLYAITLKTNLRSCCGLDGHAVILVEGRVLAIKLEPIDVADVYALRKVGRGRGAKHLS